MRRSLISAFLLALIGLLGADEPETILKRAPQAKGASTEVKKPRPDPQRLLEQPQADYKARRLELMKRVREIEDSRAFLGGPRPDGADDAVIVVVGEGQEPEDAKYRQGNNFAYLTGVEIPYAALILRPFQNKETLYLPPRDKREENYTGPRLGPEPGATEATGFDRVESTGLFLSDLFHAVADPGKRIRGRRGASVYLLSPDPDPTAGGTSAGLARTLRMGAPTSTFKDLAPTLNELRKVKSAGEIELLRKAIAITADAQRKAVECLGPGVKENQIEGAILGAFIAGGGMRAGFGSIVGSGPNSTVLHYNANRRTMRDGELVVVDIGCEYAYYTADITRTYPVGGKFTTRQREIYQLVLDCQSAVAADFKVGVSTLPSQTRFARDFFRNSKLRAKDESGVERSMDVFFTHGLGHYLGMDVHDVGDSSKPLQPGEVITIEPGLYIPSEGFGVRIEDDYLVKSDGLEKLSKAILATPDDVEAAIAQARGSKSKP